MIRQWSILARLSQRRHSRRELAAFFEVSTKTISRDIEALSQFPIVEDRAGIDVFYQCLSGSRPPPTRLTADEAEALAVADRHATPALRHTPFQSAYRHAMAKLLSTFDPTQHADVFRGPVSGADDSTPWATRQQRLIAAAKAHRCVRIRYFSERRQRSTVRCVEPYFVYIDRDAMLIGFCRRRDDFLSFAFGNMEALEVLDETFDPTQRHFDLASYLAAGFEGTRSLPVVDVVLHIAPSIARRTLHRKIHPTQQADHLPDGAVRISFRTGGTEAVVDRVLALGPDCRLERPPWLRKQVRERARAIAAAHDIKDRE